MAAANSLFVGDLAPEVSEADLHSTFMTIGHVASVRVCRDATTRASRGYGYVNFVRPEDAEAALQKMPEPIICNRPCRLMRNQREAIRRTAANLHVRDLAPTVTTKLLREHFTPFGKISSCKVCCDANGKPLGYGFVQFEREEDANEALAKLDKSELENATIIVQKFKSRDERESSVARFTNVFVQPALPTEKLEALFKECGEITSSYSGGKNFACINFRTHEQAAEAVEKFNNYDYEGIRLLVTRAKSKEERLKEFKHRNASKANLYIKNLADEIDDQKLLDTFKQYGQIISARVQRDNLGNSRGFGYVCFSNPDEARECIKQMNGRMVYGKPLYVGLHQPKPARQQENQHRFVNQFPAPPLPGPLYPPMYPYYMLPQLMPRPMPGPQPGPSFPPIALRPRGPPMPQPLVPQQRRQDTDKQSIGEKLYPEIQKLNKEKAGKITGMLLEMDVEDLRPLLNDTRALQDKVAEAVQVLKDAGQ